MSFSNITLPKPKNWQDFENQMWVLFVCVLGDPNTQKNGHQGQSQNGVDIFGYRNNNHSLVGVQCKEKYENEITDKELHAEVKKAENFKPQLDEFIMVTTAPRDQKIQETARLITRDLEETDHPMRVSVWGWDDVEENAVLHPKAYKTIDPSWNPHIEMEFQGLRSELDNKLAEIKQSIEMAISGTRPPSTPNGTKLNDSDEDTPLHGQITGFQRLIDDGDVHPALNQFLKLKDNEWANASRSERYRILVGIASAKLKLGDQEGAGELLLDAFNECPEHKNALKNRATGFLLKNNSPAALCIAREILAKDCRNANIAGILIQAQISDMTCDNPLAQIPEDLYETEEVLIAYIHFLRVRENPNWIKVAKTAADKHPKSHPLKVFYSEAVLDNLIHTNQDVMVGGIFTTVSADEFNQAVEDLYSEVHDALVKGYAPIPSTASNAALALRLSNNNLWAKEILDASIKHYPNDKNLRLQRAIIAQSEKDPVKILELLTNKSSEPEEIGLIAWALGATGKGDDALSIIEEFDGSTLPENIKVNFLSIRTQIYLEKGDKPLALDWINRRVNEEPENILFRVLQIRAYRNIGDSKGEREAFESALTLVKDDTDLQCRLELSIEAQNLGRDEVIIELLKDRVATDRESDALHLLISVSINSGFTVTAKKILDSVSMPLREKEWFQRAEVVLLLNTGDPTADVKITQYLSQWPNKLDIILAQIRIWQRLGRDPDISLFLQHLRLSNLIGDPEQQIRLAAQICHYGESERGLKYAYSVLMDHWDSPEAHLDYQGLMLMSEGIEAAIPLTDSITKDTVVCLADEDGERQYRIEEEKHAFFEDERVNAKSDLGVLLIGKKKGDKFKLQDNINSKPVEVRWIKSIYLDAMHRSLEQYNERFPRANGLQRFSFDTNAPDPMREMREVVKARAEAHRYILDEYRSKNMPLSFATVLLGLDPIDALGGLRAENIEFQVCRGLHPEREQAFGTILRNEKKGCVLDTITLSIIYRLGVEKAVISVCGPIYVPQSVLDLFVSRSIESRKNIGRKQGLLGWRNEQLVFEEYDEELMKNVAFEREKEVSWIRNVVKIVPSMPKVDFTDVTRKMIEMVGQTVCDSAIAANGNDLLLLSDDMGFRAWAGVTFQIPSAWLQPVLMLAKGSDQLPDNKYYEAVNLLALSGHTYTSLDPNCLMYQARKDDFCLTQDLSRLLRRVGGPNGDLYANSRVLSIFIEMLWEKCSDEFKVMKITSEAFDTFLKGRKEDQRYIIALILKGIFLNKRIITMYALNWLIGHSLGMPYFDELMQIQLSSKGPL